MIKNKVNEIFSSWKNTVWLIFFGVLYYFVFIWCQRLFLRQSILYPGLLGPYYSDIRAHMAEGVEGTGYSLLELYYGLCLRTLHLNERSVSLMVAFLVIACIFLTYLLMKKLAPSCNKEALHLLAFACVFVMALYFPQLNHLRYLGVHSGSNWQNDTYTAMRFAAMPLLLYYYRINESYMKKFGIREFVTFTALLIFVNWMKPNFIVSFSIALLIMLICDFISTRGRTFKNQFFMGVAVLISLAVMYFQVHSLFADPAESISSGSPIGFSVAYCLKIWADNPVASVFQSSAFPLIVLLANLKDLKRDRFFRISWLNWIIALFVYLFIHENGHRMADGNFSWGYSFSIYLIFAVSCAWFVKNIYDLIGSVRESKASTPLEFFKNIDKKDALRVAYIVIAAAVFLYHLYSGLTFFGLIMLGADYKI